MNAEPDHTPEQDPWDHVEVAAPARLSGVTDVVGPALAARLTVDPTTLTPAQLVELITGAERLLRWCQSVQLGAIAELVEYASPDNDEFGPVPARRASLPKPIGGTERTVERGFATPRQVAEFLSDGLSCALGISITAADQLVGPSLCVRDNRPLGTMMRAGVLDLPRVKILTRATLPLHGDPGLPAATAGLAARHAHLTPKKFRDKVTARVIELVGADADHVSARTQRRVWMRREESGMATFGAYLPAEDALLAWETVTAAAYRNHADAEAAEGPCQHRADGDPGCCRAHGGSLTLNNLRADAFLGWVLSEHTSFIDPETGVFDDQNGDAGRHRRRAKPQDVSRFMLHLHLNASTVAGVDDLPGNLLGYGPISADHARRLCENATVMRLLTDPVTNKIIAADTPSYRVPKILRWSATSRDGYCVFPTCERAAHTGQIDHREPHPGGRTTHKLDALGETTFDNLQSLCTRHHRMKTHSGWTVHDIGDGRLEWVSPAGHQYQRDAEFVPRLLQVKSERAAKLRAWRKEAPPVLEHRTPPPQPPDRAVDPGAPPPF